jgi:chaperonin GroES
MEVKVGDTVVYAKYSGTTFKTDEGKEILFVKESDILAILS